MTKILILIFSRYGHIETMARAVAAGAESLPGTTAVIKQVPSIGGDDTIRPALPVASIDELPDYDAIILGTPTHFGNMAGEMKYFIDQASGHWMNDALVGKVGSVFISTGSQHGGHESAILSSQLPLMHMGMLVVGLPYRFKGQLAMDEITGSSPYGAGTIAGGDGSRQPSANELAAARFQGAHVAEIAYRQSLELPEDLTLPRAG